jgi:periplasmic divalent cation tolerance protein
MNRTRAGLDDATEARFYMTNKRLVLTTASSFEESKKIARELVEFRLAACVNIIPRIESVYRWQGKVEEEQEFLLLIKTTESACAQVCEAIQRLHSYEVPECIALSIEDGGATYLKWIDESVE